MSANSTGRQRISYDTLLSHRLVLPIAFIRQQNLLTMRRTHNYVGFWRQLLAPAVHECTSNSIITSKKKFTDVLVQTVSWKFVSAVAILTAGERLVNPLCPIVNVRDWRPEKAETFRCFNQSRMKRSTLRGCRLMLFYEGQLKLSVVTATCPKLSQNLEIYSVRVFPYMLMADE